MRIVFNRFHKSNVIYKDMDDYFITRIFRFFSIPAAISLSKKDINPTSVSMVSLLTGISSIFAFAIDFPFSNQIAAVLFTLYIIADMVDGDVARISGKSSILGEWTDSTIGKIIQPAIFIGITFDAVRYHSAAQTWMITSLIILAFYLFGMISSKTIILKLKNSSGIPKEAVIPKDLILEKSFFKFVIREFSTLYAIWIFIIAGGLFNQPYYILIITLLHTIYNTITTITNSYRTVKNLQRR